MATTLTGRIMRRIYALWFVRRALPRLAVEVGVAALGLKLFAARVFVAEVVNNALTVSAANPFKLGSYLGSAFFDTSSMVQVTLLALAAALLFMFRDVIRSIVSYAVMKRTTTSH